LYHGPFEVLAVVVVTGGPHTLPSSFWISNLILSLAWQGMCAVPSPKRLRAGRDKIQLRFQKRSLAAEEPTTFDGARFLRQAVQELDMNIMFFLS